MDRRSFLTGMAIMIAAPYVVKTSGLLMPIRDRRPKLVYAINSKRLPCSGADPVGVILPFSKKLPPGWLPFDGRIITREQYPQLFECFKEPELRLTMSGCIPALEKSPQLAGDWWMKDAVRTIKVQNGLSL